MLHSLSRAVNDGGALSRKIGDSCCVACGGKIGNAHVHIGNEGFVASEAESICVGMLLQAFPLEVPKDLCCLGIGSSGRNQPSSSRIHIRLERHQLVAKN